MSLAQIGEFAFVLLSRASNLHLIEVSNQMKLCCATTVISSRLCGTHNRLLIILLLVE